MKPLQKPLPKPPKLSPTMAARLIAYKAFAHPIRWRAYRLIREKPDQSFNEIARRLKVETGLAAYHLMVLKATKLVDFRYKRESKKTSQYFVTPTGERFYREIISGGPPSTRRRKKAKRRG